MRRVSSEGGCLSEDGEAGVDDLTEGVSVFEVEVGVVEVDRGIGELARFELGEALAEPGEELVVGHVGDGNRTSVLWRGWGVLWG